MTRRAPLVLAFVLGFASPIAAQTPDPPRALVRALGGVTWVSETSGMIGGSVAFALDERVAIFGEMGRIANAMPKDVQRLFDTAARNLSETFGGPVTIDARARVLYGAGGLLVSARRGPLVRPFAEGAVGVARGASDIAAFLRTTDVSASVVRVLGVPAGETRPIVIAGAGVGVRIARVAEVEVGYRFMRIFTEDPRIDTSAAYTGVRFGF